ncbi:MULTISPECIES: VOC family protein [Burkholderiaceae]|uniref:Aldoketomutase n=1 Tax=Caballeronia sordidicola TaxID=196367 RepID=A0A242MAV0_CABSO|nr:MULTISPECIES: VOC family protein [Burkholderiaceae]AMH43137.1 lactoylglutathione lyase [Burkholderia sp. PAMC 26561]OTP68426.1 Lactoylglutathione lyase [Caballeronia sordidicola]
MTKYLHLMIRVEALDRSIAFYQDAFGMRESHRLDFDTFTLVYLRDAQSGAEIELTLNKGTTTPYTHGTGYGHVAFAVDDIEAFRDRLSNQGMQPGDLKSLTHDGAIAARFFFITDPDGYKIEVLSREGHYV